MNWFHCKNLQLMQGFHETNQCQTLVRCSAQPKSRGCINIQFSKPLENFEITAQGLRAWDSFGGTCHSCAQHPWARPGLPAGFVVLRSCSGAGTPSAGWQLCGTILCPGSSNLPWPLLRSCQARLQWATGRYLNSDWS